RALAMNVDFARRRRPIDADIRSYVEAYEREGAFTIEDFLPAEVFAQVRAEAEAAYANGAPFKSEVVEDNSVIEEVLPLKKVRDRFPVTAEHVERSERIARLASALVRVPDLSGVK